MVTVEINVTKKDIGQGVCSDPGNCPIARAVLRKMKKGASVAVCSSVYFDEDCGIGARLPQTTNNFISAFDNRREVEPFSFKLRIPNKVAKLFRKSAFATA